MDDKYKWQPGTLNENMAALIKGLLDRGDSAQDICQYFRINSGRITEIRLRRKFAHVTPAPKNRLPYIEPVPRVKAQRTVMAKLKDHRTPRDREVNILNEIVIGAIEWFEKEYGRIVRKYKGLTESEKTALYENLRALSRRYQDLSYNIELNAPLTKQEKTNGQNPKSGKRKTASQGRHPMV